MNYQTAAIVGGVAFLLSAVSALLGGVPLGDLVVRALFWAVVGFGASLGLEMVLRRLLPDLFVPDESGSEAGDEPRRVDITVDDDRSRVVFEEVDEEEPVVAASRTRAPASVPGTAAEAEAGEPRVAGDGAPASASGSPPEGEEEMPEIGAFLDAFKPSAPGEEGTGESSAPEYAEYSPGDTDRSDRRSGQVTIDGEEQDPVILAKAVQTVMKRDGQGT